jgi:hypothetical protein
MWVLRFVNPRNWAPPNFEKIKRSDFKLREKDDGLSFYLAASPEEACWITEVYALVCRKGPDDISCISIRCEWFHSNHFELARSANKLIPPQLEARHYELSRAYLEGAELDRLVCGVIHEHPPVLTLDEEYILSIAPERAEDAEIRNRLPQRWREKLGID